MDTSLSERSQGRWRHLNSILKYKIPDPGGNRRHSMVGTARWTAATCLCPLLPALGLTHQSGHRLLSTLVSSLSLSLPGVVFPCTPGSLSLIVYGLEYIFFPERCHFWEKARLLLVLMNLLSLHLCLLGSFAYHPSRGASSSKTQAVTLWFSAVSSAPSKSPGSHSFSLRIAEWKKKDEHLTIEWNNKWKDV